MKIIVCPLEFTDAAFTLGLLCHFIVMFNLISSCIDILNIRNKEIPEMHFRCSLSSIQIRRTLNINELIHRKPSANSFSTSLSQDKYYYDSPVHPFHVTMGTHSLTSVQQLCFQPVLNFQKYNRHDVSHQHIIKEKLI